MKNITAFTLILFLFVLQLPAQEWIVNYPGDYPTGCTTFIDGFVDEDGVTFLAGREGATRETPDALFMRIEPNGEYTVFKYALPGYYCQAHCIIEMENHHLFVVGNLYGEDEDYLMILILDKQLNVLYENQYENELDAIGFLRSKAAIDNQGHVYVATYFAIENYYQGTYNYGILFKFDLQGELLHHRYLIEESPDPIYYLFHFGVRQLWYREESGTLLCLGNGFGGLLAFITFDTAFNYIEEHTLINENYEKSDRFLCTEDTYVGHWYNDEEALCFSSTCDSNHNKLRASRINTQGEITEMVRVNERTDTIDDAAEQRCMAAVNNDTYYFSFYYHTWTCYPGTACVYRLNDQLEITGRYISEDHPYYNANLILPTANDACILVNDSTSNQFLSRIMHPVIRKLTPDDFEQVTLSFDEYPCENEHPHSGAYPNPATELLNIPLSCSEESKLRCQVTDARGITVTDRIIAPNTKSIQINVSDLKSGLYHYRIYSSEKVFIEEQFLKQ